MDKRRKLYEREKCIIAAVTEFFYSSGNIAFQVFIKFSAIYILDFANADSYHYVATSIYTLHILIEIMFIKLRKILTL